MKQNDLLLIVISLFLVTAGWIGFNLYHAHVTSTITETQNAQVVPIVPEFKKEVLTKLKNRKKIEPLFTNEDSSASRSGVTPTPTPSVRPTVTPFITPVAGSQTSSASGGTTR